MTDAVWIALIAGIVTTIGSIITAWVGIRNGRKLDIGAVKTQEIHSQTNGHLSKLTDELKAANETIATMHKSIEGLKKTSR